MIGAELGYRYVDSPLIAEEPGEGPEHQFLDYEPTTWPGARLPHVWLDDGTAMQDRIGYRPRLHAAAARRHARGCGALAQAFATLGAPLQVLDMPDAAPREIYGYDLLLLRPDMHVAWRGNMPPDPGQARRDGDRSLSQSHHEPGVLAPPWGAHTTSTIEPVVLRASISACARGASRSAYSLLISILILPLATMPNTSLAASIRSARVTMKFDTLGCVR